MNDFFTTSFGGLGPIPLVGFLVMMVLPVAFWFFLSMAVLRESRAWMAVSIGMGILLAVGTIFIVQQAMEVASL